MPYVGLRQPIPKPCYDGCGALVATAASRKVCPACLERRAAQHAPKRHYKPRKGQPAPYQESAESIELAFQQALKVVKATPRECLLGWSSPLVRIV